jgi:hypothetical protein
MVKRHACQARGDFRVIVKQSHNLSAIQRYNISQHFGMARATPEDVAPIHRDTHG